MNLINEQLRKIGRFIVKRIPFKMKAFSLNFPLVGALSFERRQNRRKAPQRTVLAEIVPATIPSPLNPFLDTLDQYRRQAIREGDWETAFGSAILQTIFTRATNQNQLSLGN